MKPLTKQWFEQSDYDFHTAEAMLKTGRYLYVAFMCQQAIEKLIKGIIQEKIDKTPPYSHRLVALLEMTGMAGSSEYLDLLDRLSGYYINTRYPEYKQKLSERLNKKACSMILKKTEECLQWLKKESKISEKS